MCDYLVSKFYINKFLFILKNQVFGILLQLHRTEQAINYNVIMLLWVKLGFMRSS